jgi:hypothetical protein
MSVRGNDPVDGTRSAVIYKASKDHPMNIIIILVDG